MSQTWLKQLSSSSSSFLAHVIRFCNCNYTSNPIFIPNFIAKFLIYLNILWRDFKLKSKLNFFFSHWSIFFSFKFISVRSLSCVRLFVTHDHSTPGLPSHHKLLEFTQTHVHQVGDAIQPSHPLSSPSPPTPNPSQHQSLFQWVNSSHEVAKVLEFQLQHHCFQRNPRADLLQNGLVGSPCSPRDSQESSPTPQFKSINSSVFSFLHSPTLTSIHDHWKNHSLD